MPDVTVELPGLTLTNEPGQRIAFLSDLKNWHDGGETLRDSEQRESGIGLYRDDDPAEAGRFPVVYGALLSLQAGDEWLLREKVMALKSLPFFEIRVTDPSGLWRAEVAVSGKLVFTIHDDGWAEFEIPLEAADPRLYGPLQLVSTGVPTPGVGIGSPVQDPAREGAAGNLGRVKVLNRGPAPSEPRLTVRGGLAGGFEAIRIETGEIIRVTRPISDGSSVVVDNAAGVVLIDGESPLARSHVPVSQWWQVGPGEECTVQWTPLGIQTGTPTITLEFSEAKW